MKENAWRLFAELLKQSIGIKTEQKIHTSIDKVTEMHDAHGNRDIGISTSDFSVCFFFFGERSV